MAVHQQARQGGREAGRKAEEGGRQGIVFAARAGYTARGIVYITVGILALLAAVQGLGMNSGGASGQTTGTKGAIQQLLDLPAGPWLVGAIAVGLAGYTLWRLIQGLADVDGHGTDTKGLAIRAGLIGSGVLHAALAAYAASLVWGTPGGGSGGGGGSDGWTAWLLGRTWGQWLIAAFGVVAWGAAIANIVKAVKRKYRDHLHGSVQQAGWLDPVARFGLCAKAVTLTLIGLFLISAAMGYSSGQNTGLPTALATLRSQPYGAWLLGLVAAGLVSFGLYGLIEARWRTIRQP